MSFKKPIQHSMLRRSNYWDYCEPRIYMITLTLEDRSKPLLGKLLIDSPPQTPPELILAHIVPTAIGDAVKHCWETIPILHPQVRILALQLMEEHLHGILHVTERLPRPLGNIIGSFKSACTREYRNITGSRQKLFSEGFQDTLLSDKVHLMRMFQYLQDNPKRAAVKRLFPEYFQQLRSIPFGNGAFSGIGNPFLLESASFHQVQVGRNTHETEMNQKISQMICAAERGAVIVSPCISEGERQLARVAFEHGYSLIVLQNKGFAPLYKPPGQYFNACAEGRLLMLAPSQWHYIPGNKKMTRTDACVLNALAQMICGKDAAEIHYSGVVPSNLQEMIDLAMGNQSPSA